MKCNIDIKATPLSLDSTMLESYTNRAKNRLEPGEIAYIADKENYVMWNGTEWLPLPETVSAETGKGLTFTAYDLNKSIMSQAPVLTDLTQPAAVIDEYAAGRENFMLLCRDINYYTIFQKSKETYVHFDTLGEAVLTCAQDIGQILAVDYMEETGTVEIWVRTHEDENLCMCFFESSGFIVTFARS